MRLYLSSYKFGNHIDKLKELAGQARDAVIILNARDYKEPENRNQYLKWEIETLNSVGFNAEELDLRNYFGKEKELENLLNKKQLVWIDGGNTFLLRRAMKQSSFDNIIKKLLKDDKIVYAGFSAACVVLQKDMHGLDLVDDPNIISDGYEKKTIWEGLGLIDFYLAVHYKSDHIESAMVDKEVELCEKNNIPYKTLRDGEVLIINGTHSEILK
jgi:dipeptidase E